MIQFDQVTKVYPGAKKPALSKIDFEVLRGEFVFLVGASGSGKSSVLRLILKEDRQTKGTINVLGHNLSQLSGRKVPYYRRNLGVVFQDFRLLPGKTVYENVAFTLQVLGKSRGYIQESVPDVLEMVGLEGKGGRMPHELSGGEQQRVAIARAVVNKPAILLADEPTGNLDPTTSIGIMKVLARINANGTTVIMATHDSAIVDREQRRVIELSQGVIVRDEAGGGYRTQAVPIVASEDEPRAAASDAAADNSNPHASVAHAVRPVGRDQDAEQTDAQRSTAEQDVDRHVEPDFDEASRDARVPDNLRDEQGEYALDEDQPWSRTSRADTREVEEPEGYGFERPAASDRDDRPTDSAGDTATGTPDAHAARASDTGSIRRMPEGTGAIPIPRTHRGMSRPHVPAVRGGDDLTESLGLAEKLGLRTHSGDAHADDAHAADSHAEGIEHEDRASEETADRSHDRNEGEAS